MHRGARLLAGSLLALAMTVGAVAQANAFCIFNCDYTKTKYPIVLEHGLAGFDELFGVYSYWFGIVDELQDVAPRLFCQLVHSARPRRQPRNDPETINRANHAAKKGHRSSGGGPASPVAVRPDRRVGAVVATLRGGGLADLEATSRTARSLRTCWPSRTPRRFSPSLCRP
jgi:triacylglycerol lipase